MSPSLSWRARASALRRLLGRVARRLTPARTVPPDLLAWDPALVPPPDVMRREAQNLEEWFRWAEEWAMTLRVYGGLALDSRVLEIGCGLGRVAFPLRYALLRGRYLGFDVVPWKIEFLERTFHAAYPNFEFVLADVRNSHYNPGGRFRADEYRFPAEDGVWDVVFAASVFTHMAPENAAHYFREAARVLAPGGRCVFSFFLLDFYRPGHARPLGFARREFDFHLDQSRFEGDFSTISDDDPEYMTAYHTRLVGRLAADAGLALAHDPVPGLWSGTVDRPIGAQDVVVLRHAD